MTLTAETPSANYKVEITDVDYYQRQVPCQTACPAHTDVQGYVSAIARGDYEGAYKIARQPNPFASICGRICASPCERACRRGRIDAPVTIRTLKRFISERYGAEAKGHLPPLSEKDRKFGIDHLSGKPSDNTQTTKPFVSVDYGVGTTGHRPQPGEKDRKFRFDHLNGKPFDNAQTTESLESLYKALQRKRRGFSETSLEQGSQLETENAPGNSNTVESVAALLKATKENKPEQEKAKVAVIGAGPVGLTAAHDLALLGYDVSIFEAASDAGGMALLGIPEFRLPRHVLQLEIDEILKLGVELRVNTRLGVDFSLDSLKEQGYGATLIAIGAYKDKWLDIEGTDLDGVNAAIDFLLHVKTGRRVNLGDKVVVVGGEMSDDTRRGARQRETDEPAAADVTLMTVMDAAQQALRMGVKEVHVVYRGTIEQIREAQSLGELDNALEEGIILHTDLIPKRIIGNKGKVSGFETLISRSENDDKGQPTTVPVAESESIIKCSSVILAVGQESDLNFIQPKDGVSFSKQGAIIVNTDTLATTTPGIFAGGDAIRGARTIINAVADGHQAARNIDGYLRDMTVKTVRRGWLVPVPIESLPDPESREIPRVNPPRIPLDRRSGVSEVEAVYDEASAREQASRCLQCHLQTVFNADLCILCGGCVDICPQNCYKMVRLDKIEGSPKLEKMIEDKYGIPLSTFEKGGQVLELGTAMIKDESLCTRCGLCVKRCPAGAITMQALQFEEELVYQRNVKTASQVTVEALPSSSTPKH